MHKPAWRVTSASVRGALHIRNKMPNQDAVKQFPGSGSRLPIILAVSDGHGGQKSFRSCRGARLAVHIAISTIKDFVRSQQNTRSFTIFKRIAEEQIPRELERRWKSAVNSDLERNPFSEKESEIIQTNNSILAYGATLMSVLVTRRFIIYLQIGDGDILTVWGDGKIIDRPVPNDDRLFANETTSLCTKDAWRDFRVRFQPIHKLPPKLILVATDGYSNSFREDESFMKVGSDIWQMICSDGLDYVRENLENWLNETSEAGSGDDITVGLICSGL
ncbi:MAG: protein phosphatase 2C domain-containing protein [Desulfobacteraceae bacterium]|nr:protein phosphatase 2C domain-containing protein [Desulfobacteraceae bacterium]